MTESIFLVTHRDDLHSDFIVQEIDRRPSVRVIRLNIDDFPETVSVEAEICRGELRYWVSFGAETISSRDVSVIWARKPIFSPSLFDSRQVSNFSQSQISATLWGFFGAIERSAWINNPIVLFPQDNKLTIISAAIEAGLLVPDTIVSTKVSDIYDFVKTRVCVAKSLGKHAYYDDGGGIVSVPTTALTLEDVVREPESFSCCPIFIQERITSLEEIRLYVLGNKILACKMIRRLDQDVIVDIRDLFDTVHLSYESYEPPQALQAKIYALQHILKFEYAAIDLIKVDEDYVFLEVNFWGQWLWIEREAGLPITEGIVEFLVEKAGSFS